MNTVWKAGQEPKLLIEELISDYAVGKYWRRKIPLIKVSLGINETALRSLEQPMLFYTTYRV